MDHHYNIEQQSSLPAAPRATNVGNAPYAKTVWNKKGLIWLWVLQMLCLLAHLGIEILWVGLISELESIQDSSLHRLPSPHGKRMPTTWMGPVTLRE